MKRKQSESFEDYRKRRATENSLTKLLLGGLLIKEMAPSKRQRERPEPSKPSSLPPKEREHRKARNKTAAMSRRKNRKKK